MGHEASLVRVLFALVWAVLWMGCWSWARINWRIKPLHSRYERADEILFAAAIAVAMGGEISSLIFVPFAVLYMVSIFKHSERLHQQDGTQKLTPPAS